MSQPESIRHAHDEGVRRTSPDNVLDGVPDIDAPASASNIPPLGGRRFASSRDVCSRLEEGSLSTDDESADQLDYDNPSTTTKRHSAASHNNSNTRGADDRVPFLNRSFMSGSDGHLRGTVSPPEAQARHIHEMQKDFLIANPDIHYILNARRNGPCLVTNTSGQLPCLRDKCVAQFETKSQWLQHLSYVVPAQVWRCSFCHTLIERRDRLERHLLSQHVDQDVSAVRSCKEQSPTTIPFFASCGWCTYWSTDWDEFFGDHVYSHLMGERGQCPRLKDNWATPFPPSFVRSIAIRQKNQSNASKKRAASASSGHLLTGPSAGGIDSTSITSQNAAQENLTPPQQPSPSADEQNHETLQPTSLGSPSLADLRRGLGSRIPLPEYSRALKKLESRARDRLSGSSFGSDTSQSIDDHTHTFYSTSDLIQPETGSVYSSGFAVHDEGLPAEWTTEGADAPLVRLVRALYDFTPHDDNQLTFRKGEIIKTLSWDSSGWCDGILGGIRGWFPANYCTFFDPSGPDATSGSQDSADTAQDMDLPRESAASPPPSAEGFVSLLVKELDSSVTEHTLLEVFARFGPVASIRLYRYKISQRSPRYAYIKYTHHYHGERALQALDNTYINRHPCRITKSQLDPDLDIIPDSHSVIVTPVNRRFTDVSQRDMASRTSGSEQLKTSGDIHYESPMPNALQLRMISKPLFDGPDSVRQAQEPTATDVGDIEGSFGDLWSYGYEDVARGFPRIVSSEPHDVFAGLWEAIHSDELQQYSLARLKYLGARDALRAIQTQRPREELISEVCAVCTRRIKKVSNASRLNRPGHIVLDPPSDEFYELVRQAHHVMTTQLEPTMGDEATIDNEVYTMDEHRQSQFPFGFSDLLKKRIQEVLRRKETLSGHHDLQAQRILTVFLNQCNEPAFERWMETSAKADVLALRFYSIADRDMQMQRAPEDRDWDTVLRQYTADFVRLTASVLESSIEWSEKGEELLSVLQSLEQAFREPDFNFASFLDRQHRINMSTSVPPASELAIIETETDVSSTSGDDFDVYSETASVQSMFSKPSLSSSQTSAASAAHVELFDACLDAFARHERFSQLCQAASKEMEADQFERNLRRLLTFHASQLRRNVADALETQVVRYFAARVSLTAQSLTARFFMQEDSHHERVERKNGQPEPLQDSGEAFASSETDCFEEGDDDPEIPQEEADSIQKRDDDEEVRFLPFEQVQNFVMSPETLCTFLDELEAFINRVQSKRYLRFNTCAACNIEPQAAGTGTLHYCKDSQRWRCLISSCKQTTQTFPHRRMLVVHQREEHKISDDIFFCASSSCRVAPGTFWHRADNFVTHVRNAHFEDNPNDLIHASTFPAFDYGESEGISSLGKSSAEIEQEPEASRHSLITLATSHARNFVDDVWKPLPDPDKERLFFHCACGRRVADDYQELKQGGLLDLRRTLNRMERRRPQQFTKHNDGASTSSKGQNGQVTMLINYVISFVYTPNKGSTTSLPQHINSDPASQATRRPLGRSGPLNNHLVLVLPHAKRACRVDQPSSDCILSDRGFFEELSKQYKAARGVIRSRLSWKSLIDMRFVKFDMLRSGLAQVQKVDDIPPPYLNEYEYEPVNWTPPIGPELLLHLMEHPEQAEPDQVLFKWVPKKLREKLQACPIKGHADGWGIQYIEDVDRERVCAAIFLCALASIALGVTWTIFRHDVQGGFTIAGTMFVISATGIGSAETLFGSTNNQRIST